MRPNQKIPEAPIDWRKPNNLLAQEYGVSGEAMRQRRMRAGAPAPLFQSHLRDAPLYEEVLDRFEEIRGLPKDEAERILGFQLRPARLRAFAFQQAGLSPGKEPWNRMNFDLPSVVLSRLWRIPIQNVHNQRIRNKRGAPKWKTSWNRDWMQDESFRAAQAAEELAAHSYLHRPKSPDVPTPRDSSAGKAAFTGT